MKQKQLLLVFLLLPAFVLAQNISEDWKGILSFGNQKIDLSFGVIQTEKDLKGSMTIPAQGVEKAAASEVVFREGVFQISFSQFKISYEGVLKNDSIRGHFTQNGFKIPLNLGKGLIIVSRPQTPKPPFSYKIEPLEFTNDVAKIKLSGSLSYSIDKPMKALVIIVSGSGPQDRNGQMFDHQPYGVLAHALTQAGIGVLRYDERGVGASEGDFNSAGIGDLSQDLMAAVQYLKEREDFKGIPLGLIGHSLGGVIAAKIASETEAVRFLVFMAAPGMDGDLLMLQQKAILEAKMGLQEEQIAQGQALMRGIYDIVIGNNKGRTQTLEAIDAYLKNKYGSLLPENQRKQLLLQIGSPELMSLIRSEPATYLKRLRIPVLALNGSLDVQVAATENLAAIEKAVPKHPYNHFERMEGLNHLFQEAETGLPNEYFTIEQSLSPKLIKSIQDWITELDSEKIVF